MEKFDINRIPLKIQSPHVTTNNDLHILIRTEVEKLGKLFSRITKCEMMLRIDNKRNSPCETDIKIFVPGNMLYTRGRADDFPTSVSQAFKDMHEQLRKYKEKLKDIKHDNHSEI